MVHAQNRQEQQRWNKIDGEKKTEETNVKKNGNDWPCLQPNGSRFFFKRTKIIKIGGKIRKRAIFFSRQCGSEKKPNAFRLFLFLFFFFVHECQRKGRFRVIARARFRFADARTQQVGELAPLFNLFVFVWLGFVQRLESDLWRHCRRPFHFSTPGRFVNTLAVARGGSVRRSERDNTVDVEANASRRSRTPLDRR